MTNPSTDANRMRSSTWLFPGVLALIFCGVIFGFSPNFRWSDSSRSAPYGSDFHQEWVAGYIIWKGDRDRLYDQDYFIRTQHSPSVIGYEWDSQRYYPSPYPPFYYLAVSPLAWGGIKMMVWVWVALLILAWGLAFLAAGASLDSVPQSRLAWALPGFLFFAPALQNMTMAQKGSILLALFVGSFYLLKRDRDFWAGGVLGLAAFKPHLLVVPALLLLLKRRWQCLAGMCFTGIVLVAVSLLFFGPQVCRDWIRLVLGFGDYLQTSGYAMAESHSWWGAVNLSARGVPAGIRNTLILMLCLATFGSLIFAYRGRLDVRSPRFEWQWGALMCAVVLCSPHLYTYDATLLVFPLLIALLSTNSNRTLQLTGLVIFVMIVPGIWVAEHFRAPLTTLLIATLLALTGRRAHNLEPSDKPRTTSATGDAF